MGRRMLLLLRTLSVALLYKRIVLGDMLRSKSHKWLLLVERCPPVVEDCAAAGCCADSFSAFKIDVLCKVLLSQSTIC